MSNPQDNFTSNTTTTFTPDFSQKKHECLICDVKTLSYWDQHHDESADEVPALLPCGHFFGLDCLTVWLAGHDTCPSCRRVLRHEGCGHQVEPHAVLDCPGAIPMPQTVPEGGQVHRKCGPCRKRRVAEAAQAMLRGCEVLAEAQREDRVFGGDGLELVTQAAVLRAREVLEGVVQRMNGAARATW